MTTRGLDGSVLPRLTSRFESLLPTYARSLLRFSSSSLFNPNVCFHLDEPPPCCLYPPAIFHAIISTMPASPHTRCLPSPSPSLAPSPFCSHPHLASAPRVSQSSAACLARRQRLVVSLPLVLVRRGCAQEDGSLSSRCAW